MKSKTATGRGGARRIKLVELNSRQLDVSEAVERLGQHSDASTRCAALRHVLKEQLVRVAAHCVAWLEALEVADRNVSAPRARKLPPLTEKQIDTVLHGRSA